jgi:uncharacterized GH25 family protein
MNRRALRIMTTAMIVASVARLGAHNTFIVPEKFIATAGETVTVGFHSADGFPDSTRVLKTLVDPAIHTGSKRAAISQVEADGMRLTGRVLLTGSGHIILTATNRAQVTEMKADEFQEYLEEEGLSDVVAGRAQRGETGVAAKERYTMYAKSILLVGTPGEGFKRLVGTPIELVPVADPYRLKSGERLPVRVLFRGKPIANVAVKAISTTTGDKQRIVGRSNADGMVLVPVTPGAWRLQAIYMERSPNPDADWESHWTTLTFQVR